MARSGPLPGSYYVHSLRRIEFVILTSSRRMCKNSCYSSRGKGRKLTSAISSTGKISITWDSKASCHALGGKRRHESLTVVQIYLRRCYRLPVGSERGQSWKCRCAIRACLWGCAENPDHPAASRPFSGPSAIEEVLGRIESDGCLHRAFRPGCFESFP